MLLNFKGTLDDVFTLVHEMGHSIHSYLSNKTQPTAYQDYVIFVAEVASTCNEAPLMEYLLSVTTDKKERAYLINHFLEQFRGTLYRQTMFAEFELATNEMTQRGEGTTAEALCAMYKKLNEQYFRTGNERRRRDFSLNGRVFRTSTTITTFTSTRPATPLPLHFRAAFCGRVNRR